MQVARAFCAALSGAVLVFGSTSFVRGADGDAERTALAVETLTRLPSTDLESNPKLKETVLRVLERTRGTPNFVKLVQKFHLTGQTPGLIELAIAEPAGESGVEAARLVLAGHDTEAVERALTGTNVTAATRLAEALGNTGEQQAMRFLAPLVTATARDVSVRKQAVLSLSKTADGSREVLRLAREEKLPAEVRFTATTALSQVRWPELRSEAAQLLPPAQGQGAQPLPPLAELLKRSGDPVNGARIFTNASPGCINCHVVRGRGTELGPNLSEIGTKLGKDALYEAILDPSAGISFGFEAVTVTLKNGDEAYGLLASETADEVVVKGVGGIVTRIKKAEIASRQVSKLSLMPAGLQAAMTAQELVDLVEYLSSLKKQSSTP
jgi:putative heme-binding domain-containing protein